VYPPGYVPYGRQPLAKVAPDGGAVHDAGNGAALYSETMLSAATDAAAGIAWKRECRGGTDRWWTTQCRRLERATRVVGVSTELAEQVRNEIAETLNMSGQLLHTAAGSIRNGNGYRAQGQAVQCVLDELEVPARAYQRLAEAGYLAGCWGRPLWWQPEHKQLVPTPYRLLNSRSPP
jgi:hypothetical protein